MPARSGLERMPDNGSSVAAESCGVQPDVQVRGAREHNLQDVDLAVPRDATVVFTGVSGSGKSSLAFRTLYAESQRRYLESGGDQILMCTAGSGWYQSEGQGPISLEPGSVVRVPAGTKHWHGAKADSWFSHLAFITPGEDVSNEWLEPISGQAYGQLPGAGRV